MEGPASPPGDDMYEVIVVSSSDEEPERERAEAADTGHVMGVSSSTPTPSLALASATASATAVRGTVWDDGLEAADAPHRTGLVGYHLRGAAATHPTSNTARGSHTSPLGAPRVHAGTTPGSASPVAADGGGPAEGEGPMCPVCLGPFEDKTLLNVCFHAFCFSCVTTWADVSRQCPLCKQRFTSLIHRIRSETMFEQTFLEGDRGPSAPARPRQPGLSSGSGGASSALRGVARPRQFRGYRTTRGGAGQAAGGQRVPASVDRRRVVYAAGLWVRPEQDADLVRRQRDVSARGLAGDQRARLRLQAWLERELMILVGPEHCAFVLTYIVGLLGKVDLRSHDELKRLLAPFLFRHVEHFLHELVQFALSPLDLPAYDRHARYISAEDEAGLPASLALTGRDRAPASLPRVSGAATPPRLPEFARAVRDMRRRTAGTAAEGGAAGPDVANGGGHGSCAVAGASGGGAEQRDISEPVAALVVATAGSSTGLRSSRPTRHEHGRSRAARRSRSGSKQERRRQRRRRRSSGRSSSRKRACRGAAPRATTATRTLAELEEEARRLDADLLIAKRDLLRLKMHQERGEASGDGAGVLA